MAFHSLFQLKILLPVEIQLFIENLVYISIFFGKIITSIVAFQFKNSNFKLCDLLVVFFNEKPSIPLHSSE